MTIIAVQIVTIAVTMYSCFQVLSCVEKKYIKKSRSNPIVHEVHSLKTFKVYRNILCISAALEILILQVALPCIEISILGLLLVFTGMTLRILSIIELGEYWSYNVVTFQNHKLVQTGVYRLFKHPAYIGNIYVVGLFLCFGASYSALFSFIALVVFYEYRRRLEDRLLRCQLV